MHIRCRGNVFTETFLLIKILLPSNGRRSIICFAAIA
jgi:hypothetical protein